MIGDFSKLTIQNEKIVCHQILLGKMGKIDNASWSLPSYHINNDVQNAQYT
jgi:hypothetical protein